MMKTEEKIAIIQDELKRFKVTKAACDSCIPQELIDCHEELIKDLKELEFNYFMTDTRKYLIKRTKKTKLVDSKIALEILVNNYENLLGLLNEEDIEKMEDPILLKECILNGLKGE